jgi:pimeloyl-ACP methyl ester carboxylesterase
MSRRSRRALVLLTSFVTILISLASPGYAQEATPNEVTPTNSNTPLTGFFFNTHPSMRRGGTATMTLALDEGNVSGTINFTQRPEDPLALCGAGAFSGTRTGDSFTATFTSNDLDPGCGFDRNARYTLQGMLGEGGAHVWGTYNGVNAGGSRIVEGGGVFEVWGAGLQPAPVPFRGTFINTGAGYGGPLTIDLIIGSSVVAGPINFTGEIGRPPLCGAGEMVGARSGTTIVASFVSRDRDPGCGFDIGWRLYLVNTTLSPDNQTLQGSYGINNGQTGTFITNRAAPPEGQSVSGTVRDRLNRPLAGVTLRVGAQTATTDGSGAFTLSGLPIGAVTIVPERVSYNFTPSSLTVSLPGAGAVSFVGVLAEDAIPRPLVFIPGIMGSSLHRVENNQLGAQVWPGQPIDCTNHRDLLYGNGLSFIAVDAVRRHDVNCWPITEPDEQVYESLLAALWAIGYKTEYALIEGTTFHPAWRTEAGCDMRQTNATLFVFAYDWRQSSAISARQLRDFIGCVRKLHPTSDGVDILTHSMGGLVARRYLLESLDAPVRNLVTVAAPWLGAPRAIDILQNGNYPPFSSYELFGNKGLLSTDELRDLAQSFPGAHELLPSRTYFDRFPNRHFREVGWNFDGRGGSKDVYSYDTLMDALDWRYGPYTPGTNNEIFHSVTQDDWTSDTTTPNYYHFVGSTGSAETITAVHAKAAIRCRPLGHLLLCYPYQHFIYDWGLGDETVPIESARRLGTGANIIEVRGVSRPGNSGSAIEVLPAEAEHTALVKSETVQRAIRSLLRGEPIPLLVPFGEQDESIKNTDALRPAYYLEITGAAQITVADSFGNTTDTISGTLTQPVPELNMYTAGESTDLFVMPVNQDYTVTLRSGDTPLALDLRLGTGDRTDAALRYRDLLLPQHTTAVLRITSQGIDILYADTDADGSFETALPPTANLTGAQAADVAAPDIVVTATGPLESRTVTVNVSDSESGVKEVRYSLDGVTFDVYTGPLQVNALQTPTISVFAEDATANRSGITILDLALRVAMPLVQR